MSSDDLVVPQDETDDNKRLIITTWARIQNVRSVAIAVGSLATIVSAMIVAGC